MNCRRLILDPCAFRSQPIVVLTALEPANVAADWGTGPDAVACPHLLKANASPERTVARSYLALFYRNNRLYQVEGNALVAGGQAEVDAMRFQQSLDLT
jgi:hypothetical protein